MISQKVLGKYTWICADNIPICPVLKYKKCTHFCNLLVQPLLVQQSPYQDWLELSQSMLWPPLLDPSTALLSARKKLKST